MVGWSFVAIEAPWGDNHHIIHKPQPVWGTAHPESNGSRENVRFVGLWRPHEGGLRVVLQLADECFCNPEASENLSWLFVKSGRLAYHCPGGTFCWVVSLPSKEDRNFLVASGVHNDYSPVMVRTLSNIPSMCLLGLHGHYRTECKD